jgi:hypothetical protein
VKALSTAKATIPKSAVAMALTPKTTPIAIQKSDLENPSTSSD